MITNKTSYFYSLYDVAQSSYISKERGEIVRVKKPNKSVCATSADLVEDIRAEMLHKMHKLVRNCQALQDVDGRFEQYNQQSIDTAQRNIAMLDHAVIVKITNHVEVEIV